MPARTAVVSVVCCVCSVSGVLCVLCVYVWRCVNGMCVLCGAWYCERVLVGGWVEEGRRGGGREGGRGGDGWRMCVGLFYSIHTKIGAWRLLQLPVQDPLLSIKTTSNPPLPPLPLHPAPLPKKVRTEKVQPLCYPVVCATRSPLRYFSLKRGQPQENAKYEKKKKSPRAQTG